MDEDLKAFKQSGLGRALLDAGGAAVGSMSEFLTPGDQAVLGRILESAGMTGHLKGQSR